MEARLLKIKEVSRYLGISIQTLYQWTSQRRIPFIKIGQGRIRFDIQAIDKWIRERSINPRNF